MKCQERAEFFVLFAVAAAAAAALIHPFSILPSVAAAMPDSSGGSSSPTNSMGGRKPLIVRLHMVRHGETEANRDNYVLGQRESPLTQKGVSSAVALGSYVGRYPFWRAYSSDYDRTVRTARLILGRGEGGDSNGTNNSVCDGSAIKSQGNNQQQQQQIGEETMAAEVSTATSTATSAKAKQAHTGSILKVIPDKRLRERAKGPREGRLKSITFEEAAKLHMLEYPGSEMPLCESDEDVWDRVKDWIDDVVADACNDAKSAKTNDGDIQTYHKLLAKTNIDLNSRSFMDAEGKVYERTGKNNSRGIATDLVGNDVDPRAASHLRNDVFDVLVVSHSATIRTAVNRLVGDELPSNILRGSGGDDGATKGMLVVPNTSRTIVDIVVSGENNEASFVATDSSESKSLTWNAKLIQLTNTDHLKVESTRINK